MIDADTIQYLQAADDAGLVVTKGSGIVGTVPERKWSVFGGNGVIGFGATVKEAYLEWARKSEVTPCR